MLAGLHDEVAACVRRHGLTVPSGLQVDPAPLVAEQASAEAMAGWLPVQVARRYGYLDPSGDGQILVLDSDWSVAYGGGSLSRASSARLSNLLTGPGPDSCLVAGIKVLLGGRAPVVGNLATDTDAVPLYLMSQVSQEMQASAQVAAVTARWRQCMSAAGYHYAGPDAAQSDPRWLAAGGRGDSLAEQVALQAPVATADARCRAQVGYVNVLLAVIDSALSKLIDAGDTRARLEQFRAKVVRWIQIARHSFPAHLTVARP